MSTQRREWSHRGAGNSVVLEAHRAANLSHFITLTMLCVDACDRRLFSGVMRRWSSCGGRSSLAALISCLALSVTSAFVCKPPVQSLDVAAATRGKRAYGVCAASNGLDAEGTAVVLGYLGGVGELLARKLASSQGVKVKTIFANQRQVDGVEAFQDVEVAYRDFSSVSSTDLQGVTTAFVSFDRGVNAEDDDRSYSELSRILESLPASAAVVMAAYGNDTAAGAGGFRLFSKNVNPREVLEEARGSGTRKCVFVQHGRLFGYMPGQEPLPFTSGPLQRPNLEESFAKQSVLLSVSSAITRSRTAATLRSALAESMIRAAQKLDVVKEFSLVSLEGSAPSDADWEQQFVSVDTSLGVVVYDKSVGGEERVELPVLQEWLTDDFGPSISQLAISRVLSTAKPTLMVKTSKGGDLLWQTITSNLEVQQAGRWSIQLDINAEGDGSIRILRVGANGQQLTEPLPGEEEVLQKFSEAINKLTYTKRLSKKRAQAI